MSQIINLIMTKQLPPEFLSNHITGFDDTEHNRIFSNRPADNDSLWHYTSLESFEKILESSCFKFSRLDGLLKTDFLEGNYSDKDLAKIKNFVGSSGVAPDENIAICCFNKDEKESEKMWKEYANQGKGVAIKTTFQKLEDAFQKPVSIEFGSDFHCKILAEFSKEDVKEIQNNHKKQMDLEWKIRQNKGFLQRWRKEQICKKIANVNYLDHENDGLISDDNELFQFTTGSSSVFTRAFMKDLFQFEEENETRLAIYDTNPFDEKGFFMGFDMNLMVDEVLVQTESSHQEVRKIVNRFNLNSKLSKSIHWQD